MYVRMYGFFGVYYFCDLVRQVSGFIIVSVSAYGTCRIAGFKGGGKPCLKACIALNLPVQL